MVLGRIAELPMTHGVSAVLRLLRLHLTCTPALRRLPDRLTIEAEQQSIMASVLLSRETLVFNLATFSFAVF